MNNCCNTKINFPSDKFKDCCEVIFSNCIAYTGPEGCLDFGTYPNLNDVISTIIDHICQANTINTACLISKGYTITGLETFSTAVSDVICQILGCQVPAINNIGGTITSLCDLNNRLNTQSVLSCFRTISVLNATATMEQLLSAIQTTVCQLVNAPVPVNTDEKVKCSATDTTTGYLSQKLQGSNTVTINIQNAGGNEFLKPDIKIDPASTLPYSISAAGLKLDCCVPAITDAAIQCQGITTTGAINSNAAIAGVTFTVPYVATIGGSHPAIVIPSNESVGGTPVAYASLPAGTFNTPNGNLVFSVTGNTTSYSGSSVSFTISVNGGQCLVTFQMIVTTQYEMICDNGYWNFIANPMKVGDPVTSSTGSPYLQVQINVSKLGTPATIDIDTVTVDGLTFAAVTGYHLTLGANLVHIPVSGTPTQTAITVPISIHGTLVCNFQLTASPAANPPGNYNIYCQNCQALGSTVLPGGTETVAYNQNISLCYNNGVNGPVPAQTVIGYWLGTSTASGLVLNIPAGTIAALTGNIATSVTGTPLGHGTVVFNIPNSKCSLTVPVAAPGVTIDVEANVLPRGTNAMELISVSFNQPSGGNVLLDWPHQMAVTSYPGYYMGAGGLGYHAANMSFNQVVTISYTDSLAPHYQAWIQHVHVDYFDNSGGLIGVQEFDQNAPGDFTSPSGLYIFGGRAFYTSYNANLVVPPTTARIVFTVLTLP